MLKIRVDLPSKGLRNVNPRVDFSVKYWMGNRRNSSLNFHAIFEVLVGKKSFGNKPHKEGFMNLLFMSNKKIKENVILMAIN